MRTAWGMGSRMAHETADYSRVVVQPSREKIASRPKSSQHYCRAGCKVDRPTSSDETPPRPSAAFSLSGEGFAGSAVRRRVSDLGVVINSRAATERPEPPFPREVSLSLPETRARVMTGLVSL